MSEVAELLERFRRGGELLAVVTTGAAGAEVDYKPAPDKWCVRQLVCHLADSELVAAMRFRLTLAEENPTLGAYNQDLWAENLDYKRRKVSQAVESFRRMRTETFELLKEIDPGSPAWNRTANHVERGSLTLLDLLRNYAEHVENHCKQIHAVRQQYKQSKKT